MEFKKVVPILVVLILFNLGETDGTFYYGYGRRYGRGRSLRRAAGGALLGATVIGGGLLALGALALLGKKKRSADGSFDESEDISPYEDALRRFDLAMEMDEDMCGERTLCEIMANKQADTNPSPVTKVLRFIYSGEMPLLGVKGHEEATNLLEAGLLGKLANSDKVCALAFKTCKVDFKIRKQELEDAYAIAQKYDYQY